MNVRGSGELARSERFVIGLLVQHQIPVPQVYHLGALRSCVPFDCMVMEPLTVVDLATIAPTLQRIEQGPLARAMGGSWPDHAASRNI